MKNEIKYLLDIYTNIFFTQKIYNYVIKLGEKAVLMIFYKASEFGISTVKIRNVKSQSSHEWLQGNGFC